MNYIKQLNAFHLKIDLEPISIHTLTRSHAHTLTRSQTLIIGLSGSGKWTHSGYKPKREYQMVCLYRNVTDKLAHNLDHKSAPLIKEKQNNRTTAVDAAVEFFQNNFGVITPFIDEINNWANDLSESLVLHAMKRALERGKANRDM